VWDVFLQVFDEGRLTDLQGNRVDFRRTVIILTSNLGAAISRGATLGFERAAQGFNPEGVRRSIRSAFRPEFLNRIDRVVVFRPFDRAQMRALLDKELREVVHRRGLRGRPWAIEYDDAALRFLIDRGFSPELGARPLKRAVEEHLLAPLARAIVEQSVPSGDQFLFVTAAGDRIEVTFVDPDAPETAAEAEAAETEAAEADAHAPQEVSLRRLALSPRTDGRTLDFLSAELDRLDATVSMGEARRRKEAALAALGTEGFWDDPGRFAVLAEANYLDRLEEAFRTAQRLHRRLDGGNGRSTASAELVGMLALRLHVIESALAGMRAGAPDEVFLRVRPAAESGDEGTAFAGRIADMYIAWARRRGMQFEVLAGEPAAGGVWLLLSGLGAGELLGPEAGVHVLEADDRRPRVSVMVEVAARAPETAEDPDVPGLARRTLARRPASATVVRRYREGPAPLVRDAVRGFRTGRLDRVLAGDFDLL
jgi:ATP-dependent Clp protease ATP-binding subunit ClpC